jgi:hypothetical protein
VVEAQGINDRLDEDGLPRCRLEQLQVNRRPGDLDGDAGEAGTGADVEDIAVGAEDFAFAQGRAEGEGLDEVALSDYVGIDVSDEIGTRRPLDEQVVVAIELRKLLLRQPYAVSGSLASKCFLHAESISAARGTV